MLPDYSNFLFLKNDVPQLFRLGALAERYFPDDPNTSQIKLRQFSELAAALAAARFQLETKPEESLAILLRRLRTEARLPREVGDLFHSLRESGNDAVHSLADSHASALSSLKVARQLGLWFYRTFYKYDFSAGAFRPPRPPVDPNEALSNELTRLQTALEETIAASEQLRTKAESAETALLSEQERTQRERADREVWEALAQEAERRLLDNASEIIQARIDAQDPDAAAPETLIEVAQDVATRIELDEAATRTLIDQQLRDAGWEADTLTLRFKKGARPIKGRNLAIAEWPTATGPADYALFCGTTLVGVIEAKRSNRNVMEVLRQAERYANGAKLIEADLADGAPWGEFVAPFAFSTNGRPFLRQVAALSGIWRRDLRKPTNAAEPLTDWPSPQGLLERLSVDIDGAHQALEKQTWDFGFPIRPYQKAAIEAVETNIIAGRRAVLLAMATGTGKTKLAIAMLYRLNASRRFRRVCFVVDRSALGEQAEDEFKSTKVVNGKAFADIFGLKGLTDVRPDPETRIHICTIQGLVKRVLYTDLPADVPAIDQYDLIVIDECHRGYLLDREMSDSDLAFRDQSDYISKYRRVLEHFDAVKIGLTATPALHTAEIFGNPVFTYSYREAVVDGFLVDHEPPIRIATQLATGGIQFAAEDQVDFVHTASGQVQTTVIPDELDFEIEAFNRGVITVPFNQVVAHELTQHIDLQGDAKTLVFAVNDAHADILVDELRKAFRAAQGTIQDADIAKITGKIDKPSKAIRSFRNDAQPKIAVTVDLLTTGIDVPKISNLVFMRRVNSRILYEQMLGRATRLCPEIGKESFRIFDAVDLYATLSEMTDMRPVAADPTFTLTRLFEELVGEGDAEHRERIRQQIVVRMRRRIRQLPEDLRAQFELAAGEAPEAVLERFRQGDGESLLSWTRSRPGLGPILDWTHADGTPRFIPISEHSDEVTSVTRGYGEGRRPEDFLEAFNLFIRDNLNTLAALAVVVQRPQELTREELRQLRLRLDAEGFSNANISRAWTDATNEEIAASIIGFIRQAAIGDPLVPYTDRVNAAVRRIAKSKQWTSVQRQWLDRIGEQMKQSIVVDRAAFDAEPFESLGGWDRTNTLFGGDLSTVLSNLNQAIWEQVG